MSDFDGVNLAAIKALSARTERLQAENGELRAQNQRLQGETAELRARLDRLEAALSQAKP
jgi:predicted nuclease with TOPRIM domain